MKALLYRNIVILVYVLLLPLAGFAQRAGDLDRSFNYGRGENYGFNYGNGANNVVSSSELQSNGRIILFGAFTTFNDISRKSIARIFPDGALDLSFEFDTSIRGNFQIGKVLSDDKILVSGVFNLGNDTNTYNLIRLNANGSLDPTFIKGKIRNNLNTQYLSGMVTQQDDRILVGGYFSSYNGISRRNILRLLPNGMIDTTFNPELSVNSIVNRIHLQQNRKILLNLGQTNQLHNKIIRLYLNGTFDPTFTLDTHSNRRITIIYPQENGRILIVSQYNRQNDSIERLTINGSIDTTFKLPLNRNIQASYVDRLTVQPDGKIVALGKMGRGFEAIKRYHPNGQKDSTFTPGIYHSDGSTYFYSITLLGDKYLITGSFRYIFRQENIILLNANGSIDYNFNPLIRSNNWRSIVGFQQNGKIIVSGLVRSGNLNNNYSIFRLNTDGSFDTSFKSRFEYPDVRFVVQGDDKIIVYTLYSNDQRVFRLNSDGTYDSSFVASISLGTSNNSFYGYLSPQADGKILASIGTRVNGFGTERIVRLNSNGSLDASYDPFIRSDSSLIGSIRLPDGKFLIQRRIGQISNRTVSIERYNNNGTLDNTFRQGIFRYSTTEYVHSLSAQLVGILPEGKLVLSGEFISFSGNARPGIIRLNTDGSLDTNFNFQYPSYYSRFIPSWPICLLSSGKIVLHSSFTSVGNLLSSVMLRFNNDGSFDSTYKIRTWPIGPYTGLHDIKLQPDGKIILLGPLNNYDGVAINSIARIHGNDCPTPTTIDVSISGNLNFCLGDSVTLTSSQLSGNLWSNGDTTRSITVKESGVYTVRTTLNGCTSSISNPVSVNVNAPASPITVMENEINHCFPNQVVLSVAGNYNRYRWNTGDTTRSISVRVSGRYSARVLDTSGCWSVPASPMNILFETTYCQIRINITGIDSLLASIEADNYQWFLNGSPINYIGRVIPILGDGVYTVRAFVNGQASPLSEPFLITSSNKKSINAPKLKLYPNPTTGIVTLTTSPDAESIAIINAIGQIVYTSKAQPEMELNLSHLPKGVYMVQVQGNKGVSTKRLVIQ